MNRIWIWGSVGLLTLAGLLFAFVFSHIDPVTVTFNEGYSNEAMSNPNLAFERFMARMGRPVERSAELRQLDALTLPAVVILGQSVNRRELFGSVRSTALARWVGSGGHLIMGATIDPNDPLLRTFGISWKFYVAPKPQSTKIPQTGSQIPTSNQLLQPEQDQLNQCDGCVLTVSLPGARKTLMADMPHVRGGLSYTAGRGVRIKPNWTVVDQDGIQMMQVPWGLGSVTVIANLGTLMGNGRIDANDNAEVLWDTLNQPGLHGAIYLFDHLRLLSMWQWLAESAWMVLVSFGLTLLFGLWMAMPRFGPTVAHEDIARRSLREHLAAMGRAVWRQGGPVGMKYWLDNSRSIIVSRWMRRDPSLSSQELPEQVRSITALSGQDATTVEVALMPHAMGQGSSYRVRFTRAMACLQKIDLKL
jgi:hypothetical protein